MKQPQINLWAAFYFSTAICAITVVANLIMRFLIPNSYPEAIAFLCNLPLCFYFATLALRDTRGQLEALETRIKQLESEQPLAKPVEVA